MDKKLGVIVPFRNRHDHLRIFLEKVPEYLKNSSIDYEIIIVDQDNGKQFNRGALLNIGFIYAEKMGCDYVVFHDVDLIPVSVDYSYSDHPVHLASHIRDEKTKRIVKSFDRYFGGVTLFPIEDFRKINGYSNKYWGWGFEDDDLFLRCENNNIGYNEDFYRNMRNGQKSLFFNGTDSYVKIENKIDLENDLTIFVSFFPEDFFYDPNKDVDVYTVFSVPGYDTSISYNSFNRYNFVTFDERNQSFYINSKISTNYLTNVCITIDSKKKMIRMYQDGNFVGETSGYKKIRSYKQESYVFLGAGNPERAGDPNFFKGYIDTFVVIDKKLENNEIVDISETYDFSAYTKDCLKLHYNANHIKGKKIRDLSGNGNHGRIYNCLAEDIELPWFKKIGIPKRRGCLFESLYHENNGFSENKWKDKATRWNQLRFYNEVSKNSYLISGDGLSDLSYTEYGVSKESNILKINIGL